MFSCLGNGSGEAEKADECKPLDTGGNLTPLCLAAKDGCLNVGLSTSPLFITCCSKVQLSPLVKLALALD